MEETRRLCFCYSAQHGAVIIGIGFFIASTVASLMLAGLVLEWNDIEDNFGNERTRSCEQLTHILDAIYAITTIYHSYASHGRYKPHLDADLANILGASVTRNQKGDKTSSP